MTVKATIDFIRPLAVATYKHVSFCYTATNLGTIATTLNPPFFPKDGVLLKPNSY